MYGARWPSSRTLIEGLVRAVLAVAILMAGYFVLPFESSTDGIAVTMLVIGLIAFVALVVF
jgi:hypothetical protein